MAGRILAIGGYSLGTRFDDLILELAGGPRVLFVPTASTAPEFALASFHESFGRRAEASHVRFSPWPPEGLRELALAQDAIYVAGGNTANALAIWRVHGFDAILREAWQQGVLLCGWSAGMICWFEASVTDSFGPDLTGMRDGLGFLPAAPARTTTARSAAVRSTQSWCVTAFRPGSPARMRRRRCSTAPSSVRSSHASPARARTASVPRGRSLSKRGSSEPAALSRREA